ncbi:MAG: hypothetical protein IJU51_02090 [Clostridia bacterium]|nr:hypothetical protein [Clostridia bacterium]
MIDLSNCEHAVLVWLKDVLAINVAVDLVSITDAPNCRGYSKNDIVEAIQRLNEKQLIKTQVLPSGDPTTHFVVYEVTEEGRELV